MWDDWYYLRSQPGNNHPVVFLVLRIFTWQTSCIVLCWGFDTIFHVLNKISNISIVSHEHICSTQYQTISMSFFILFRKWKDSDCVVEFSWFLFFALLSGHLHLKPLVYAAFMPIFYPSKIFYSQVSLLYWGILACFQPLDHMRILRDENIWVIKWAEMYRNTSTRKNGYRIWAPHFRCVGEWSPSVKWRMWFGFCFHTQ